MVNFKNFSYNTYMKDKEKIKETAHKISELEVIYKTGSEEQRKIAFQQLEKITENLSLEEMLEIDNYILENKLLK